MQGQSQKGRSRFINIKCQDCGNEQVVFSKSNSMITCMICGATLVKPGAGKAVIKGNIIGVMDHGKPA
jgi:small subunit ribosomal protein S27e